MADWTRTPFGVTADGRNVEQWTARAGGYRADVLTYGGILRSFAVEGRDVVLGCDTLADYEKQDKYFGALVGRVANRIGGAGFDLNGVHYPLAANNGPSCLHGGIHGFHEAVWEADIRLGKLVLSHTSPDGEEGFPGTLRAEVSYDLTADGMLTLDYRAVSDRDTLTWERVAEIDGAKRSLSASFSYETVRNKEKTTLEGEAELENAFDIASSLLTGKAWVEQTLPDDTRLTWVLEPDMTFALGNMDPEASGSVLVTYKEDKRITQESTVFINMAYGDGFNWELRPVETDLESLSEDALKVLQEQGAERLAADMLRGLLRLPQEDLLFISEGLSEEAWQRVLEALGGA